MVENPHTNRTVRSLPPAEPTRSIMWAKDRGPAWR